MTHFLFSLYRKIDPVKFPQLQSTERLTSNVSNGTKVSQEEPSVGKTSSNLEKIHAEEERYKSDPKEITQNEKENDEIRYTNDDKGDVEPKYFKEEILGNIKELPSEKIGLEQKEREDSGLELKPLLRQECHQPCDAPINVNSVVVDFQESSSNDTTYEASDTIAKDMLSFAWQIAIHSYKGLYTAIQG